MEQRDQEKLSDRRIRAMFEGAGDFIARQLTCCGHTLWAGTVMSSPRVLWSRMRICSPLPPGKCTRKPA